MSADALSKPDSTTFADAPSKPPSPTLADASSKPRSTTLAYAPSKPALPTHVSGGFAPAGRSTFRTTAHATPGATSTQADPSLSAEQRLAALFPTALRSPLLGCAGTDDVWDGFLDDDGDRTAPRVPGCAASDGVAGEDVLDGPTPSKGHRNPFAMLGASDVEEAERSAAHLRKKERQRKAAKQRV
ncbi:hypothetical protein PsYK624_164890 [Phanerochaete sordida]|uniref:Uncharacterized protein n=1 Tax=Phanerochaete sordida TaxID=48140 RepID=A0A9P3GSD2_9APHY|nr:hypothetical protein PsYK624_164890 [Phanerochaete sordida]